MYQRFSSGYKLSLTSHPLVTIEEGRYTTVDPSDEKALNAILGIKE